MSQPAVLNIFLTPVDKINPWGYTLPITKEGLLLAGKMALRLVLLIIVSTALTYTTSPIVLTDGIEKLLKPLSRLGVPTYELAMMMSIAIRFIPTLIEETEKIMSAQKARGANLESGGLLSRIKALIPILIPLLISSFRRAAELADAMECRCYHGGKGRTRMKQLHLSAKDFVFLFLLLVVGVGIVFANRTLSGFLYTIIF